MSEPLIGQDAPLLNAGGGTHNQEDYQVVPVTDSSGKVGEVYAHELPGFIANGGRVATKGELGRAYSQIDSPDIQIQHNQQQADIMDRTLSSMGITNPTAQSVATGLFGAADVGTAGLIPSLAAGISGNKQATAGLFDTARETSPLSYGAGGALGILLASRLGPGATQGAVGKTALSAIARTALTSGVENAIYGGTNYVTDSYLHNRDLSLDKLIYHTGMSGLIGSGIGGSVAALGRGAEFILPKVGEWAEKNVSIGAPSVKQASKEANVSEAFSKIREAGIDLDSREGALTAAKKVRDSALNDLGEIFNKQKTKASLIDLAGVKSGVSKLDLVDSLTSEAYDAGLNNGKVRDIVTKSVRASSDDAVTLDDLWSARNKIASKASPEAAFVRAKITNQAANDLTAEFEKIGQPELASKVNGANKAFNLGEAAIELTRDLKEVPAEGKSFFESLKDKAVARAPWALASVLGGHLPIGAAGMAASVAKDVASQAVRHAIPTAAAGMAIGKAVSAASTDISSQVGKFINGNSDTGKQKWLEPKYTRSDYNNAVKKYSVLAQADSHPVVSTMSQVDPQLGQAMQDRLTSIANNVVSRAKDASGKNGGMAGVSAPRMDSEALNGQEMGLMRYIHAIEEPASVMRLARVGGLSSSHVDALKENMPSLYNDMLQQIHSFLQSKEGTKGKGMTMSGKAQLSLVMGQPVDFTTDPLFIAAVQSSFTKPEEHSSAPAVHNGGDLVDSKQYETGSEKVEQ